MGVIRNLFKRYFFGFIFFYSILRYRIFLAVIAGVFVGILDGLGLTMFLPLLQLVGGSTDATSQGMGNLDFIVDGLAAIGIPLTLQGILLSLIVFFCLKGIVSYFGNSYQVRIRQFFLRRLRLDLLSLFNRIEYKAYMNWDVGRIQNVFTTETERITTAFIHYFKAMNHGVNVFVYSAFAFTVDPQFAGLVIVGGLLSHFLYRYLFVLSKGASRNLSKGNSVFHGLMVQHIANFKYLKATARHLVFGEKLEKTAVIIEQENTKLGIYGAILSSAREPLLIVVVAGVIFFQTEILGASLAPILISLLFFYRALTALNNVQTAWNLFIRFSGSLENVSEFTEDLKMNREKVVQGQEFRGIQSSLQLSNVSFGYNESDILKDVNLKIYKNESIAIVGISGSGKTTLLNILSGLLKPTRGKLLFDDDDFSMYDMHTFQKRVGFITQEPVVFSASIFENITFWDEKNSLNKENFQRVIEKAALKSFIDGLPLKEDTIIGNQGVNLSGGQRQRLSIARELYRDIDILIMDEATSALDSETEQMIRESIDSLKGNYTMITVAHRIATIKNVDRVALMEGGRLINILPFNELILKESKFRRMVELQEL